jgi:hypothetical protein
MHLPPREPARRPHSFRRFYGNPEVLKLFLLLFWFRRVLLLGQSILSTVAIQTALNSLFGGQNISVSADWAMQLSIKNMMTRKGKRNYFNFFHYLTNAKC